jgi:H-type lectin domain
MARTLLGTSQVFSQWPSGPMWTGTGPRNVVQSIAFPPGYFSSPPKVIAAISGLDCGHEFNTRVNVTVQNITTSGFKVKVDTWADTQLAMVAVAWTAHQP